MPPKKVAKSNSPPPQTPRRSTRATKQTTFLNASGTGQKTSESTVRRDDKPKARSKSAMAVLGEMAVKASKAVKSVIVKPHVPRPPQYRSRIEGGVVQTLREIQGTAGELSTRGIQKDKITRQLLEEQVDRSMANSQLAKKTLSRALSNVFKTQPHSARHEFQPVSSRPITRDNLRPTTSTKKLKIVNGEEDGVIKGGVKSLVGDYMTEEAQNFFVGMILPK